MNILFLTINNLEEPSQRGIYSDLIRKFRDKNHKVFVATAREKRLDLPTKYEMIDGISYLKIRTGNITKSNILEKGLATLTVEALFLKAIKSNFKKIKFDLILYATPPITFSKVISYIKKRDGAMSYLLLKDIFPQNAVDIGLFSSKSILNKYFRIKEKKLYKLSDYIGCMSPTNVNYILENNNEISEGAIEVNPNTITPEKINIQKSQKIEIREKYNLPANKSIFIYGGNLGKPQGIDFLIDCIKRNEKNHDSFFLIVGSGTEYNKLKRYFSEFEPQNAKLLNQLPKKDYELLANTCDVGLIFLDNRFTIPNFPSRLLSYMQASMPVLAATDLNTDIGPIIEEGNFGFFCISDDVEEFNNLVVKLSNKKTQQKMGRNARNYLENNYTSEHSYSIIMNHFS